MLRQKVILIFFLLLAACQSRDEKPPVNGAEYFPLRIGMYWTYNVSETNIYQVGGQTNDVYQLRIAVTDSVKSAGQTLFILQRSRRNDSNAAWSALDTWSARVDPRNAVLQKGNTPFVILTFPLTEGKTWDGNALNNLGGKDNCSDGTPHCDIYTAQLLMKRFESTGIAYEDTVTILENNEDDRITGKDIRKSVYGRDAGLIYHEETILQYCTGNGTSTSDCIGKQIVESGHILKLTVASYGSL